jgi:hypothetical protein
MIRSFLKIMITFSFCGIFISSCMNDELWLERNKPNLDVQEVLLRRGMIILNEGNFTYGNTSMSYYDIFSGKVENDVFYRQNGVPLGDVAHSAAFSNGLLYVVINNSGKVLVLNLGKYTTLKAFEYTGKITGLSSPRYVEIISESKAYISDLYARKISVFDPQTLKLTGDIPTPGISGEYYRHSTEQMIVYDSMVFTNCYNFDDQILIIDYRTDKVIDSIQVLKQPSSMVSDRNRKLWVLCDGGYEGSTFRDEYPGLMRIDLATRTIEKAFIFPANNWPRRLCINGSRDTLYFINGDIWKMSVKAEMLPEESFIPADGKIFYSLGIDPVTSEIYAGDAIDFVQQGIIYRYNMEGIGVDTIRAGVNPGYIMFLGVE